MDSPAIDKVENNGIFRQFDKVSTRQQPAQFSYRSFQGYRGISFSGPAVLSALAALLLAMMKGSEESPGASSKKQKDQIIDIDEYTVVDDRH
jgi:hypothetical protein